MQLPCLVLLSGSENSPWNSSISITLELTRNARIRKSESKVQSSVFSQALQVILMHIYFFFTLLNIHSRQKQSVNLWDLLTIMMYP